MSSLDTPENLSTAAPGALSPPVINTAKADPIEKMVETGGEGVTDVRDLPLSVQLGQAPAAKEASAPAHDDDDSDSTLSDPPSSLSDPSSPTENNKQLTPASPPGRSLQSNTTSGQTGVEDDDEDEDDDDQDSEETSPPQMGKGRGRRRSAPAPANPAESKQCNTCFKTKSFSEFRARARNARETVNYCIACQDRKKSKRG